MRKRLDIEALRRKTYELNKFSYHFLHWYYLFWFFQDYLSKKLNKFFTNPIDKSDLMG